MLNGDTAPHSHGSAQRPVLAMVTGHLTPYRVAINRRIAREIPELELRTVVTKNSSTMWKAVPIPEIGTVMLDDSDVDWEAAPWLAHLKNEFAKGRRLVAWLGEHRPAALMLAGYDEVPNLMALAWGRRSGVPVFLTADSNIRADISRGVKRLAKRLLVPLAVRRFTGVLACGRLGRAFFEYYGAKPANIFYVPLEPDYRLIEDLDRDTIESVRQKHALAPNRRRLVMCARLIALKRTDQVIDAFSAIAAERPDWDLIIIGDGPLRSELEGRVREPLRARVRFLGFVSDTAEVAAIYRASDALVLASMQEAWALVINEAAAAGLAIIGSDVIGAVPELVRENVNGAVFPAGDLEALTAAMRRVTDQKSIDRLKQASRGVLDEWRRTADPVAGIRTALAWAGVIPGAGRDAVAQVAARRADQAVAGERSS